MPTSTADTVSSEEPVTPVLATGDGNSNAEDNAKAKPVIPPTAPKGKPKAPPLIHARIKPNEADDEMLIGSGSKIPLLKSKHTELEYHADSRKRPASLSVPNSARSSNCQSSKVSKASGEVHRTVEKVRVSKGIQMKRVVQESNGIKPKRSNSSSGARATINPSSTSTKESSHQGIGGLTNRRKMIKTEASFPEVKSFTGHIKPTVSGNDLTGKSKGDKLVNQSTTDVKNQPSNEVNLDAHKSNNINTKIECATIAEAENAPVDNFKTIDEFLKMPETTLPETKTHSPPKKMIYKSKFWDYLDPKASKPKISSKEYKKPYDPNAVKTFMQKQKEVRKLQQVKETKEREAETAKRQKMLKELNTKCQKIALKGKQKGIGEEPGLVQPAEDLSKTPKLETQSPSMKYLKPLLDRKQGSLLRKSESCGYTNDVARQSQYLLAEFENIVKRECINFLQKIPAPPSQTNITESLEKVDKAVATSVSLLELNCENSEQKASQNEDVMDVESLEYDNDQNPSGVASPAAVEKAVTKIQACYRGYIVRKALKDARIAFRKPICKKITDTSSVYQGTPSHSDKGRRWSFPKMPEKPYDNLNRLLPMSPIPMGLLSDSSIPCYIPPPPSASQTSRSPLKPRVLPTFPLTPSRIYDEPYPKQTRKSMDSLERSSGTLNHTSNLTQRDSFNAVHPNVTLERSSSKLPEPFDLLAKSSHNIVPINSSNFEFEFSIPSSIPSIVDVLREKIRLFSKDNEDPLAEGFTLNEKLSNEWKSINKPGKDGGDISTATTNDEQSVDHEEITTPKIKRHKRRSRPRSQRGSVGDSTTTVDTDADYVPSATRSSDTIPQRPKPTKPAANVSTNGSKSEETIRTSSVDEPPSTSSFDNFIAPALKLRYEAEREHLKIIEQALKVKLHTTASTTDTAHPTSGEQKKATATPETDRVQLAIANCQKESMKAAAEMAKWMSEFQKSTKEQELIPVKHSSVDIAATVIAAVEQARAIGIEKRKDRHSHDHHKSKTQRQDPRSLYNALLKISTDSESHSSELLSKADKAVETSLNFVNEAKESLMEKEEKRGCIENTALMRNWKDQQQQFPSESERDSPIPALVSPFLEVGVYEAATGLSRKSSPEEDISKLQDQIDYPSIIPSGNTVDFTSLDLKVSTLDYISQLSSEKGETDSEISYRDENNEIKSNTHNKSDNADIHDFFSDQSGPAISYDGSFQSHQSTILDEASKQEEQVILDEASIVHSRLDQSVSEHLNTDGDLSLKTDQAIKDEVNVSGSQEIVTESKIQESNSEHSEVGLPEPKNEDIIYGKNNPKIAEIVSEHDDVVSPEPTVEEIISEQIDAISSGSKIEEIVSEQDDVVSPEPKVEEIISEQIDAISSGSKIEEIISDKNDDVDLPDSEIEDIILEQIDVVHTESKIEEDMVNSNLSIVEDNESQSRENTVQETPDHEALHSFGAEKNLSDKPSDADASKLSDDIEIVKNTSEICSKPSNSNGKLSSLYDVEDNAFSENESDAVEDKATETELFEDHPVTPEKEESSNGQSLQKCTGNDSDPRSGEYVQSQLDYKSMQITDVNDVVQHQVQEVSSLLKQDQLDKESSIIEDLAQEDSDYEEAFSPNISLDKDRSSHTSADHESNKDTNEVVSRMDDNFEEDVTAENEPSNVDTNQNGDISRSIASNKSSSDETSVLATHAKRTQFKPPPPYSAPARDSEKLPSLDNVSPDELLINEDIDKEDNSVIISEGRSQTSEMDKSQQASFAENIIEKSQSEAGISERIIDETSEQSSDEENDSKQLDKQEANESDLNKESFNAEDYVPEDRIVKPDFDVPLKPPPPYSPSSSLESTSLSSRSLMISLPGEKLEKITREQVDAVWEAVKFGDENPETFPSMNNIMKIISEKNLAKVTLENNENTVNFQSSAEHNLDVLLCHLIYETMKEALQIRNPYTSFIERVRPGPLSLQAQKSRIPKTKEALVANVLMRVIKIVPPGFFSDPQAVEVDRSRFRKWCSRPRELVDEILLEELVDEDYQWTEWWPEEVIISNHISTKIMQTLIRNALQKRKYVYSQ